MKKARQGGAMMYHVLIVDDEFLVRLGLKQP